MKDILFIGDTFTARDGGEDGPLAEFTPVILGGYRWHIGLLPSDGILREWDGSNDKFLPALWRGVRMLSSMKIIDEYSGSYAYELGLRQREEDDFSIEDRTKSEVDRDTQKLIMKERIPDEVISILLSASTRTMLSSVQRDHEAYEEEILLGTLPWRDKFANWGIRHPNDLKTLEGFERLIVSYKRNVRGRRFFMEHALLKLLKQNAEIDLSERALIAVAGMMSVLEEEHFFGMQYRSQKELQDQFFKTAEWLANWKGWSMLPPFGRLTTGGAEELLVSSLQRYAPNLKIFQRKRIVPLD